MAALFKACQSTGAYSGDRAEMSMSLSELVLAVGRLLGGQAEEEEGVNEGMPPAATAAAATEMVQGAVGAAKVGQMGAEMELRRLLVEGGGEPVIVCCRLGYRPGPPAGQHCAVVTGVSYLQLYGKNKTTCKSRV